MYYITILYYLSSNMYYITILYYLSSNMYFHKLPFNGFMFYHETYFKVNHIIKHYIYFVLAIRLSVVLRFSHGVLITCQTVGGNQHK